MSTDPPRESLTGHYAGPISRLGAYVIDAFMVVTSYGLGLSLIAFLWQLIGRKDLTLPAEDSVWWLVGLVVWGFIYFAGSWGIAAKTVGMAVLGIRVVNRDGSSLAVRHAVVRTLALPLSFLLVGIGLIGIVIGKERRALHDVIGGTTVVYDWDARAARLRVLSRQPA